MLYTHRISLWCFYSSRGRHTRCALVSGFPTCALPILPSPSPASTGKTAALTARLAHLIATRRAYPSEILAVTFTNKAAREVRERVGRMIGPAVEERKGVV